MTARTAVHAVTRGGAALGRRVADALGADLHVAAPVAGGVEGALPFPLPMREAVARTFRAYDAHVFVLATGATVRLVAPLLESKWSDPAVVCLDERATFAVSLLSGHAGGANALAARVARATGATPVVTTASDVQGTIAVDLLGREAGYRLEDPRGNATRAAAAVVNGDPVLLVDETSTCFGWPAEAPLPENVTASATLGEADPATFAAILLATDRVVTDEALLARAVLYRPPTLAVGVGCDRGASAAAVARAVEAVLAESGLATRSVASVATIDLKGDEPGIVALAERLSAPLRLFPAAALDRATGIERPSLTVKHHVGTRGVCEPAALLAAGADHLLVPKQIRPDPEDGRSVTVAVARIPRRIG